MLDPRRGFIALTFFSHKFLRWLVPHCMILAAITNLALIGIPFYAGLGAAQVVFYTLALFGYQRSRNSVTPGLLRMPLFFVSMNLALLFGFWKYLTGKRTGTWARTVR